MADVAEEILEAEEEVVEEFVEEELEEEEDEFVGVGGAAEIKLFGKWSFDDIEIRDISLVVCYVKRWLLNSWSCELHAHPLSPVTTHHSSTGLHCLQGRSCRLSSSYGWTLPKEAFPQGFLSHY